MSEHNEVILISWHQSFRTYCAVEVGTCTRVAYLNSISRQSWFRRGTQVGQAYIKCVISIDNQDNGDDKRTCSYHTMHVWSRCPYAV